MDLALNNLQKLICHKTQNQANNQILVIYTQFFVLNYLYIFYLFYTNNLEV